MLVPIDFSPASEKSVRAAATLASETGGLILILHVAPLSRPADFAPDVTAFLKEESLAAAKVVAVHLARVRDELKSDGLSVEIMQRTGHAAELILAEQKLCGASYIVIGSHGHGGLYEAIVGSTTRAILKDATCPVVVVPVNSEDVEEIKKKGRRLLAAEYF